jgi:hypothetical protein
MERICDHGIGHPDPDDIRVRERWDEGVHGCDGCCHENENSVIKKQIGRRPGDPVSYKESWNDLKSALKGALSLYGEDVKIQYVIDFMEKKEERMQ